MVGLGIYRREAQASEEWIAAFAALQTAVVSDVMNRMVAAGPHLRPMHDGTTLCGPAVTVKARPGDNLFIHAAIDLATPGDVIVVDGDGDLTNALAGELMVAHAKTRRLGGFVIHGAIRDSAAIAAQSFPVFAVGVTHRGPYRDGPGVVNQPVALGGMVIAPGDLMLGDADGVVAVPIADLAQVHAAALAKQTLEAHQLCAIESGTSDRGWVSRALAELNCPIET